MIIRKAKLYLKKKDHKLLRNNSFLKQCFEKENAEYRLIEEE